MGFLYPAFLIAGLALAIPLAIHLFNLRRYKRISFPHSRFLRNIQLRSHRSSQLRYKLLLALRLLFVASLVLAFAQPLFNRNHAKNSGERLQVLYIDNNPAMGLRQGLRSGLDIAIDAARTQINKAPSGSRWVLLSNDKPSSYEPHPADKILAALSHLELAPSAKNSTQVLASVQSLMQTENLQGADLYYFSDFPQSSFSARPSAADLKGIRLHAIAVQPKERQNIFIDTAFLNAPVLQTGSSNTIVVRSKLIGKAPAIAPVLQLAVNGQVKSAASLRFDAAGTSTDTLHFFVSGTGWQRISLALNDAALRSDDTFFIAARSAPSLSVLVLNEGPPSLYVNAAFRSYAGFSLRSESINNTPSDWSAYNLIVLNGITALPESVGRQMQQALTQGQSICIFPAKTKDLAGLNAALTYAGDIRINMLDTATQTVASLQPGAELVRNIFESIPQNVQLPVANWHYSIAAGLNANGQNILSFRNGDPFFARYASGQGRFYLCATSADLEGGNFAASYFFLPFLYQMAAQSRGGDVYALSSGSHQAAFVPLPHADERNLVHLYAPGLDAIPPQRPAGGGVAVFVDAAVQAPGFYTLAAPSGDSALVALNGTRAYSDLELWDMSSLRSQWPDKKASWETPESAAAAGSSTGSELPLWKVCAIFALILLAAETAVLLAQRRPESPLAHT